MSMLSKELEATLTTAFNSAHNNRHEFITVEHLLFALLDNESARAVMVACGCDINALRDQLAQFIDESIVLIPEGKVSVTHPTIAFQRVLQRALFHIQASNKKEVTGANLLVALFSEEESQAIALLNNNGVSKLDAVYYLAHGISKLGQEINEPTADSETDNNSSLYKVILLNDDFTPMSFVIEILMKFFDLTEELATNVMLQVHTKGVGICGTFSKVVAETKVYLVNQYSRDHQHPLLCSMEEM